MYHIEITDGERTIEEMDASSYVLAANVDVGRENEGVMCAAAMGSEIDQALQLLWSMDELRLRAFQERPILAYLYHMKHDLVDSQENIELTGLRDLFELLAEGEDEYD